MKNRRTVIIADDDGVVVHGLRLIVEILGGEVVGIADSGPALVQLAVECKPEIVILEIHLPGLSGIETMRPIQQIHPDVKFMFFTREIDLMYVRQAFHAGAQAYVLKTDSIASIREAWTEVVGCRYYVSRPLKSSAAGLFKMSDVTGRGKMTTRQSGVLRLLARGKTAREIAGILRICVKTGDFHQRHLMDKLGLRTIAQLSRYAASHGLLDDELTRIQSPIPDHDTVALTINCKG